MVKRMTTPATFRLRNGGLFERDVDSTYDRDSGPIHKTAYLERRTKRRFPIELPAELFIREKRFLGKTVNISSGGLLLKCSHESVKIGKRVRVRIKSWPNSDQKDSEVVLVIDGAVVRDSLGYVAVRRNRYEFVED
jgi:hypothetical protein